MFKRLSLHGTDITRQQAEIHPVDPDQKGGVGLLAGDWEDWADLATPTFHRLPIKRSIGGRRTLWRRGDR
ncbi:MAG: hypothetical protein ACLP4V_22360 [Methylocella sp.]